MIIAQIIRSRVPPIGYGGTERDVFWLADYLAKMGHRVYLVARPGSKPVRAELVEIPPSVNSVAEIMKRLPPDVEIAHFHFKIDAPPAIPFLATIHGNMAWNETVPPNTVFQSQDQARRHGSRHYVYNGVDLSGYGDGQEKEDYLLFLAKFLFRKGLDTAIALARELGFRLIVAGGWRPSLHRNIEYVGEVDGERKRRLLSRARALLFPIRWPEPLSLVALESLASGTPIISSRAGSMPEIVSPDVGFLCDTYDEFAHAIRRVGEINPEACRKRADQLFNVEIMAGNYLRYYEQIIKKGKLGDKPLAEYGGRNLQPPIPGPKS